MAKRQLAWFIQDWLAFFERRCGASLLQRGRGHFQQGHVRKLEADREMVSAYVLGLENYQVKFTSTAFSQEEIKEIGSAICSHPILLMGIYQKTVKQEDVAHLPHQLGLGRVNMKTGCSCHESTGICSHQIATAYACAEWFNDDYTRYLTFCGIDWDAVLMNVGNDHADLNEYYRGDFSLLPVPEGSIRSFESRIGGAPDFWTSSFPFHRMLEEIFHKIREEAHSSQRK